MGKRKGSYSQSGIDRRCRKCGSHHTRNHPVSKKTGICTHGCQIGCEDCGRQYGHEYGFPDLIIPFEAWRQISTSGTDGGLLCPSCICKRLHDKGIRCEGAFMSGPIRSVSEVEMSNLRRVENIELAIKGRDNAWSGIRELVDPSAHLGATE